jgi:glycine/D-amino acid oxidase-like deaminating enzyme
LSEIEERLPYLNQKLREITGKTSVFSKVDSLDEFGFSGVKAMFHNRLEGQLNPSGMMDFLQAKAREKGVRFLSGIPLQSFRTELYGVQLLTPFGTMRCANLILATNGFSQELLPGFSVLPARAQVMVTSPIDNLPWEGTFHADRGYYYFRNIENRVLLGGGRNLDFEGETNSNPVLNEKIQVHLEELLRKVILPGKTFSIEYRWAGIMGVGNEKKPIIEKIHDRIAIGVRMGGMGVAIGTNVGRKLAELF